MKEQRFFASRLPVAAINCEARAGEVLGLVCLRAGWGAWVRGEFLMYGTAARDKRGRRRGQWVQELVDHVSQVTLEELQS